MRFDRVALLRAVNVGGRQISMAELRELFEERGFAGAKTLLQSGNVVFAGGRRSDAQLEKLLETATRERFGIKTDCFIRGRDALSSIIERNPFKQQAKSDPARLVVHFLKEDVPAQAASAFASSWKGPETIRGAGAHAYVYYPDGQGRSKLKLPWLGTARNWNTVTKLYGLLE
jgi:uncharacterized protein (DUF1697 family)